MLISLSNFVMNRLALSQVLLSSPGYAWLKPGEPGGGNQRDKCYLSVWENALLRNARTQHGINSYTRWYKR